MNNKPLGYSVDWYTEERDEKGRKKYHSMRFNSKREAKAHAKFIDGKVCTYRQGDFGFVIGRYEKD